MPLTPIKKSQGLTESEKYLISLAERSFLNLWSYPNLYKQQGKELCDLLVVCGEHILVFSDKTIAWPDNDNPDISWRRWYKKAIKKSSDQVKGAIRWLENFPDEIYLNAACTEKFPLPLPPKEKRKITGIVVALGAKQACVDFFEGSGSLLVKPELQGNDHINVQHSSYQPFAIGDINPDGEFIHVFDDVTLNILMKELDTITDLTDYFDKKERFLRSGHLFSAHGEEDLLAQYLKYVNENQEHDFLRPDGKKIKENDIITLDGGLYNQFRSHPSYIGKKVADRTSYVWDNLIKIFTDPIMEATAFSLYEEDYGLAEHEEVVRYMALEDRMHRRMLGECVLEAVEKGKSQPRFGRAIMPGPTDTVRKTGYVFMMLAYPEGITLKKGYDQYRATRSEMLMAYCMGHYRNNQHVERVIGIAMEPPPEVTGRKGMSEDLVLFEPGEWTDELERRAEELCERYDVLRQGRVEQSQAQGNEYPDLPENSLIMTGGDGDRMIVIRNIGEEPKRLNRRQRRKEKAKNRQRRHLG